MVIGPRIEVIVNVSDMNRAVRFYRDVPGIAVVSPRRDDFSLEFRVVLKTGACRLCLHGGGTQKHGADSPKIVFQTDDIHAARTVLLSNGVNAGEVFSPADGVFVCNSTDPDGNRFSLESPGGRT
jgi:predicted enzyme related to lactoylglutathione lyase